jgi:hypothetical protein
MHGLAFYWAFLITVAFSSALKGITETFLKRLAGERRLFVIYQWGKPQP